MQHKLSWDDLQLVGAIAEQGNLSRAAAAVGLNHSSVYRRLKKIEARVGVRLFDRTRTRCLPTAAGAEAAAVAAECAQRIENLQLQIAGRDTRLSGVIRITSTDSLLMYGLMPALRGFRERHPDVQIELLAASSQYSLTRREADVAIRPTPAPPPHLVGRPIRELQFRVYGHQGQWPGTAYADAKALRAANWVAPDDSLAAWAGHAWVREQVPASQIVMQVNSVALLHHAVASGIGLGVLPAHMVVNDGALRPLSKPLEALASSVWVLTHPELRQVARIRALMQWLADDPPLSPTRLG